MATDHVSPASAAVDGAAEERFPSWILLEGFAYFDNVDNKHIQITFCPRAPPLLSRFCVHSPDGADMHREPLILAMEDDLALIRVDSCRGSRLDYYVYQADDVSGKPSLTLLPRVSRSLHLQPKDIGLLRLPGKEYLVAGFRYSPATYYYGGLTICVYHPKREGWKVHTLSLSLQGQQEHGDKDFVHRNCKVLTIGGDAGTMAFVDLWRGVLFCDVLKLECEAARQVECEPIPLLDYVSLPDDLRRTARVKGDACLYRDIAFLDGHLKCVDLPSWSLWIRPATTSGAWSQQYMIRNYKEIEYNNKKVNLLPGHKSVYRSFAGLNARQPVVDLQDNGDARILYFTVKTDQIALQGSVLAVDLLTKKILNVAPFVSRYHMRFDFTYMHTRLFKHLSGAKVSLNQSGMVLQGSASKMKHKAQEQLDGAKVILNQSGMVLQGFASKMKDKAQEQRDGEYVAEDGDAMALD